MALNGVREAPASSAMLRRSLGLPQWTVAQLVVAGTPFRRLVEFLSCLATPLDWLTLRLAKMLPVRAVYAVLRAVFSLVVNLHKTLPQRFALRGLSDSLSVEAHALTSLMWASRLAPVTLPRIRLGLSSVSFAYPVSPTLRDELVDLPEKGVRGCYLHTAPASIKDPPVILYFFGGAFFGGAAEYSRGLLERYAGAIGCDAFLVDYRRCPEYLIEDAFRDGCRCYEWLLSRTKPQNIVFLSVSSGGGVALRVLQLAAAPEAERCKYFWSRKPIPQPAGQVHMGPFVNFTVSPHVDPDNSLRRHQELDLVVTERVYEFVQPRLDAACGSRGDEGLRDMSPLFHDMKGLCPTLLSFATHEVCVDDNRELARRLRAAGCKVDVSEQPFLWHAFQLFAGFMPEGEEEMQRILSWIKARNAMFSASAAAVVQSP